MKRLLSAGFCLALGLSLMPGCGGGGAIQSIQRGSSIGSPPPSPSPPARPSPSPSPSQSPTAPPSLPNLVEYQIPTSNSGPLGISMGPDGNLWFTEQIANQIGRITPQGKFSEFSIPTAGSQPWGITAGPDGNLWFTEAAADRIGRITRGGAIAEFSFPTINTYPRGEGIAAGPDGNLWFVDSQAYKIGRITTGGAIAEFALPTGFGQPTDITAGPDGNLWFTTDGNPNGNVTPSGTFSQVGGGGYSITVGPDRNIWFTGYGGAEGIGTIVGGVAKWFGTGPWDPWQYGHDIATGPDGNLWFGLTRCAVHVGPYCRKSFSAIGKITVAGNVTEFSVPELPEGIAAGPGGTMWFTEPGANKIARFMP